MSTKYSERKISEILAKVNGQAKLAEQAIQTLAQRDPAFLESLVSPFLNGIIAHGIDRARKQTGLKEPVSAAIAPSAALLKRPAKPAAPAPPMSSGDLDSMMKAWAKKFETQSTEEMPPGQKVSQSHLDAMKALAVKSFGTKK